MIPLAACSVLALWIILDRAWHLRRREVVVPEIVAVIDGLTGSADIPLARSICERHPGPFSAIVRVALESRYRPRAELREQIEDQGRQEVARLERGLGLLETIAAIAPLLGLLGTVLGMIEVFEVVSQQGAGRAQGLSGGIAEALITTAAGLSIGIPALVAYNYFTGKAERLVLDLESHTNRLLQKMLRFRSEEGRVRKEEGRVRKEEGRVRKDAARNAP
ncbi:MAG TPA: MotA/TolQ/ExbB proton channel family protein [Gemmatimonadota bacterium]|nr:MotA/TolQ/ExbB proton channel family protein [Gemmatimonadota bacterium]